MSPIAAPAKLPGSVTVTHSSENKIIAATWDEVVLNHDEGEAEVYQYHIRLFECGDEDIPEGIHL